MVEHETAKALKDAGLVWKIKTGDYATVQWKKGASTGGLVNTVIQDRPAYGLSYNFLPIFNDKDFQIDLAKWMVYNGGSCRPLITFEDFEDVIWLPRLDQMLQEIERRGWKYGLDASEEEYFIRIAKREHQCLINEKWRSDTAEEAAAQSLLWILGEGD